MKKNIGSKLALYPTPVVVVGAMNGDEPTWTLVAHTGIPSHSKLMVSLAGAHFINGRIKKTGVLSVNIVDESWLDRADFCGSVSGARQSSEQGRCLRLDGWRGRRPAYRRRQAFHGVPRRGCLRDRSL